MGLTWEFTGYQAVCIKFQQSIISSLEFMSWVLLARPFNLRVKGNTTLGTKRSKLQCSAKTTSKQFHTSFGF